VHHASSMMGWAKMSCARPGKKVRKSTSSRRMTYVPVLRRVGIPYPCEGWAYRTLAKGGHTVPTLAKGGHTLAKGDDS
jgi:hypothetical protein